jgi:hypothetical protein
MKMIKGRFKLKSLQIIVVIASLMFGTLVNAEADTKMYTKESKQLLEQLQQHIEDTLRKISDIESQAGNDINGYLYSVEVPAKKEAIYIGLIMDEEKDLDGYRVLSVTPGSLADKLQIEEGDVILSINQIEISPSTRAQALHSLRALKAGDTLTMSILHRGSYRELDAKITTTHLPDYTLQVGSHSSANSSDELEECGEISISILPPETQDMYQVSVNKIDGETVLNINGNFRLALGSHTLELIEHIRDPYFARRRGEMKNAKMLEIDVEPDIRFHLAAKFNRNNRSKLVEGGYWDPVVWKKSKRECNPGGAS